MKPVCLDLRGCQRGFKDHFGRGLGRMARCLSRHLPEAAPDLDFVGLIQSGLPEPDPDCLPGFPRLKMRRHWPPSSVADRLLGQEIVLPRTISGRVGLIHYVAHLDAPAWTVAPTVVSVNDLILQHQAARGGTGSGFPGDMIRRAVRGLEAAAVRRARAVSVLSEHTASEVVSHLGVDRSLITVIPPAADALFRPVYERDEIAQVKRRFDLPDRYLVTTGGFDPRKNLIRLVRAFGRLIGNELDRGAVLALVGATGREQQVEPVRRAIATAGLEGRVRLMGFVEDAVLPALYSGATGLVFPSLSEGFGLPALEAMACGCPVVLSRGTSLPEVAGEAGLYFDPLDEAGITRTMAMVLNDPDLARRYRTAGIERAKEFSWQKTAAATAQLYRRVLTKAAG